MPKHPTCRDLFIPDPGFKLLELDLKQAEAMIVAWLSEDEQLKRAFREGDDVHSLTGAMLFGLDPDWVVANKHTDKVAKKARQTAKPVNHGFNYSMGPKALMTTMQKSGMDYTFSDCRQFLARMRAIRPAVPRWHEEIRYIVSRERKLVTPLGYSRFFLGSLTDKVFRDAYAFIPQSTVGHMLVITWNTVYEQYGHMLGPIMNVHDSLIIQIPNNLGESELDFIHEIAEHFLHPLTIKNDLLIIPVEAKVGHRLGSLEDLELDEGALNEKVMRKLA